MVRVARPRLARCSCTSGLETGTDFAEEFEVSRSGGDGVVSCEDGGGEELLNDGGGHFGVKNEDIDKCEIFCFFFGCWRDITTISSFISFVGLSFLDRLDFDLAREFTSTAGVQKIFAFENMYGLMGH